MNTGRVLQSLACVGLGVLGGSLVTPQLVGQPAIPPLGGPRAAMPGREWLSVAPVVNRVLPGVVLIESQGREKKTAGEDTDPGFGSGVLIDPSGVILTNNHVVNDLDAVEITLHDGRKFTTTDIRRDPKSDIALVKIESKQPLPVVELGDSNAMEVGDRVLAIGAPFGLLESVTSGIVSAKGRKGLKLNPVEDFIQTDAAVNSGNSGGALVNMDGKVIGLTAAIKTRTGGFQGIGLAVSSNLAKRVGADLLKNGGARRTYIGASVRNLDEDAARKAGYKGAASAAVVTSVAEGSPAAKAGVLIGDVITKVNGVQVRDRQEFAKVVSTLPAGQTVDVLLWRGGKFYRGKVTVEEGKPLPRPTPLPGMAATTATSGTLGLAMTDFTAEMAKIRKLPDGTKGAAISGVEHDSLAEKAGLTRSWIVLKADKTPVTSALSFEQALRKADPEKGILLDVLKPDGDVVFVVLPVK